MKRLVYMLFAIIILTSCRQEFDIDLSGEITTVQRDVDNYEFTSIKLHGGIELELESSANNLITVETDDSYQKYVLVNVLGRTLDIKRSISANLSMPTTVKVRVSADKINEIIAWRESQVELLNPLIKDSIHFELQQNCEIIGKIICNSFSTLVHDNSIIELSGEADSVTAIINENSRAKCFNLTVSELNVEYDDSSSCNFNHK